MDAKQLKIAIAGTGYVGLSNGILLAQHNDVIALDISPEKIEQINNKISPISDPGNRRIFKQQSAKPQGNFKQGRGLPKRRLCHHCHAN